VRPTYVWENQQGTISGVPVNVRPKFTPNFPPRHNPKIKPFYLSVCESPKSDTSETAKSILASPGAKDYREGTIDEYYNKELGGIPIPLMKYPEQFAEMKICKTPKREEDFKDCVRRGEQEKQRAIQQGEEEARRELADREFRRKQALNPFGRVPQEQYDVHAVPRAQHNLRERSKQRRKEEAEARTRHEIAGEYFIDVAWKDEFDKATAPPKVSYDSQDNIQKIHLVNIKWW